MCKSRDWSEIDQQAEREASRIRQAGISVNYPRRRHYERRDQLKVFRLGRHVFVRIGTKKFAVC